MTALILKEKSEKILIVGPIYDKISVFQHLNEIQNNYKWIVINGNLCYPFHNLEEVQSRITLLQKIEFHNKIIYNLGNYDLQLSKQLYESNTHQAILQWLRSKYNVIMIQFENKSHYIITNGGLLSSMTRESLKDNLETTFVSSVEGVPWHQQYNGIPGYVISNNPLTLNKPKFYRFSAQIGNLYHADTKIFAQEISPLGLKRTILLRDTNKTISF